MFEGSTSELALVDHRNLCFVGRISTSPILQTPKSDTRGQRSLFASGEVRPRRIGRVRKIQPEFPASNIAADRNPPNYR